ncbi:Glycosyl transferases group 1 [Thiohalospira halophila DSM 15071]|uniref:Glycosyl transferases group 1 n=1 Tax=Thiohalospira halophila DSM 15071 TaxID=1123397 RepID=A0A1I1RS77_9GAMM|nr:Glycosyl transferases group 1 [Thiohalospira halophila DSM 15071]
MLVEALAAGAPVVSTDCPSGPREILEDGKLGPLVPVDDVDALAEAMERTLNRPPPADERERSLERFRSGPVARQYLETMGLREPAADAPDKPHEGDPT